jgi:hypothetical protein
MLSAEGLLHVVFGIYESLVAAESFRASTRNHSDCKIALAVKETAQIAAICTAYHSLVVIHQQFHPSELVLTSLYRSRKQVLAWKVLTPRQGSSWLHQHACIAATRRTDRALYGSGGYVAVENGRSRLASAVLKKRNCRTGNSAEEI